MRESTAPWHLGQEAEEEGGMEECPEGERCRLGPTPRPPSGCSCPGGPANTGVTGAAPPAMHVTSTSGTKLGSRSPRRAQGTLCLSNTRMATGHLKPVKGYETHDGPQASDQQLLPRHVAATGWDHLGPRLSAQGSCEDLEACLVDRHGLMPLHPCPVQFTGITSDAKATPGRSSQCAQWLGIGR